MLEELLQIVIHEVCSDMQFIDRKLRQKMLYTACSVRHGEAEVWLGPRPFFLSSSQGHSSSLTYQPPNPGTEAQQCLASREDFLQEGPHPYPPLTSNWSRANLSCFPACPCLSVLSLSFWSPQTIPPLAMMDHSCSLNPTWLPGPTLILPDSCPELNSSVGCTYMPE